MWTIVLRPSMTKANCLKVRCAMFSVACLDFVLACSHQDLDMLIFVCHKLFESLGRDIVNVDPAGHHLLDAVELS